MGIKNRLDNLLKTKNMNANELAIMIDVRPSTIYSILQRDSSRIDIDLIIKIARALDVTADELLSEEIAAASESPIDSMMAQLLSHYEHLNEDGRKDLVRYARLIDESGEYRPLTSNKEIG